jgi:hypothetical protein
VSQHRGEPWEQLGIGAKGLWGNGTVAMSQWSSESVEHVEHRGSAAIRLSVIGPLEQ